MDSSCEGAKRHGPCVPTLSRATDACDGVFVNALILLAKTCRRAATVPTAVHNCDRRRTFQSGLRFLEHTGLESVPLQQLVELGAIALGELRCLRDVAAGDLQQPDQVIPLE